MITVAVIHDASSASPDPVMALNAQPDIEVIGAARDLNEATAFLQRAPTVVVFDLDHPRVSSFSAVSSLRRDAPSSNLLALTKDEDFERIYSAVIAGVDGYVVKNDTITRLSHAVREIANGGAPMGSKIVRQLTRSLRTYAPPVLPHVDLSRREREVLQILVRGHSYQEIAERLFVSIETVRTHVRNIYRKLGVHSWTEIDH